MDVIFCLALNDQVSNYILFILIWELHYITLPECPNCGRFAVSQAESERLSNNQIKANSPTWVRATIRIPQTCLISSSPCTFVSAPPLRVVVQTSLTYVTREQDHTGQI